MSARLILEQQQRLKREAELVPPIDPVAAPNPTFEADDVPEYPIDQDYQLEDGETWVQDDDEIGQAYVEPATADLVQTDAEPGEGETPADDLLGPMPGIDEVPGEGEAVATESELDPLGTDVDFADEVTGETPQLDSEPFMAECSFKIPGTKIYVTEGDMLAVVREGSKFKTRKSIREAEENPDVQLDNLAYGSPTAVDDEGVDDGTVVDEPANLVYHEAQVNWKLPTPRSGRKTVFEKHDKIIVRPRFIREAEELPYENGEADGTETGELEPKGGEGIASENVGGNARMLPPDPKAENIHGKAKPGFNAGSTAYPIKPNVNDKKAGAVGTAAVKVAEDQGLVGRRTSRALRFSMRQQPDPKSWQ
jgi:hypothetical protein